MTGSVYEIGHYFDEGQERRQSALFTKSYIASDTGDEGNNYVNYRWDSSAYDQQGGDFAVSKDAETQFPIDAKLTFRTVGRYDHYGHVSESILSPTYTGGQHWTGQASGYVDGLEGNSRGPLDVSTNSSLTIEIDPGSGELEIVARRNDSGTIFDEAFDLNTDQWEPEDPTEIDYTFEDFRGAVKYQPGEIQYREYELASTKSTDSTQSPSGEEPQTVETGEDGRGKVDYDGLLAELRWQNYQDSLLDSNLYPSDIREPLDDLKKQTVDQSLDSWWWAGTKAFFHQLGKDSADLAASEVSQSKCPTYRRSRSFSLLLAVADCGTASYRMNKNPGVSSRVKVISPD